MSRQIGLIIESTETGITRAVIENGRVVLQTLEIVHEVPLAPGQLTEVQAWVRARTYQDPVLDELARVEEAAALRGRNGTITCVFPEETP